MEGGTYYAEHLLISYTHVRNRPSFTQPPARKLQKLDVGNKPKKSKHSKLSTSLPSSSSSSLDSKVAKEPGQQDTSLIKVKGDTPDRFWTSVEPYCADITEADLLALQEDTENVSHMTRKGAGPGGNGMLSGWMDGRG